MDSELAHQRFIVKFRQDTTQAEGEIALGKSLAAISRALPVRAGKASRLQHLRRLAVGADVLHVDTPLDRIEAEALMRRLAADRNVEYVEIDRRHTIDAAPNDPRFGEQWGLSGTYGIKAAEAWGNASGAGVVVAVLDTGIASHSDLNANVLPGYDFIGDLEVANDGDGRDGDASDPGDWVAANQCGGSHGAQNSSWHGTHVAGTIAAVTNNGKGVAGVAPGARIVLVRVLGRCGGYTSDIADGIVWAAGGEVSGVPANAHPAEVINLSLGGPGACGSAMQSAINSAVGKGATLVIAAGNSNVNVANASPANCNNVIAVGASDSAGKRSIWSSSQQSNHGPLVDVAAPGSGILSTVNSGSKGPAGESYASYGGTSMAAPHV
ncbi:MAG: S8 family peptidase, partial [Stenotrophomonas sp.]